MPTGCRSRPGEGTATPLLVVLVLLLAGLTGCTFGEDDPAPDARPAEVDAAEEVRDILARRTAAVRDGDLTAFLADVHQRPRSFVRSQRRYFLNLRELPLARFGYELPEGGMSRVDADSVAAVVWLRMQLDGYDARPVVTPALHTFARKRDGTLRIVSDQDRRFAEENDVERAPWDLTRIEVLEGDGVLGIFDAGSEDEAFQIIASVEEGIRAVDAELPLEWSRTVVVYALSDVRVLAELDNLPGGDPNRLDGVAFPVPAGPRGRQLAGVRFMLHPRMIERNDDVRDRLIRHELTHVALARRDDRVPTWLSEGIAEYVSVQAIPPFERKISRDAVGAALAGVGNLPADRTFNGALSAANYGLAWYACEHIVAAYGEDALWRLFDAMRAGKGTPEKRQDRVLQDVLGIDGEELARAATGKILNTFG